MSSTPTGDQSREILLKEIQDLREQNSRLLSFQSQLKNSIPEGTFASNVFNSTVEGMWTIGNDGLIRSVNKAAIEMFAYNDASEMVGKHSHALVHHSYPNGSAYPMEECPIYKAFQEGVSVHLEDEVLWRKDGTCFFADYRSVPIYDEGEIIGAVVTFLDNSDKVKTLEELKLNQAWHAATLKGIGDAVITTDAQDPPRVSFLNPVAEKLCGWTNENARGQLVADVFNIVNQTTRAIAVNPIHRVLKEGIVVGLANHTVLISKDQSEYVIEDSAAPIKSSEGTILGVVLVFRDVTVQKEAERRADTAETEMINALESTSDSFFALDKNWIITAVNSQHEKTGNLSRDKQVGHDFRDLFLSSPSVQETQFSAQYHRAMKEQVALHFEEYFAPLDLWTSVNVYPKKDGGITVFYRDITREKKNKEMVENHQKWLEYVVRELPMPVYMVDPKTGKYSFGNRAMEQMLGAKFPVGESREIQQKEMIAIETETGRKMTFDEYPSTRVLRSEDVKDLKFTWRTRTRDYHVSVSATTVPAIYGSPSTAMLVVTDITEQVLARRATELATKKLENEKKKLEALVAESPSAMAIMRGPEQIFEMANTKWKQLVSEDRQYEGHPYREIYPELADTPAHDSIKFTFNTGKPFTAIEMRLLVKSKAGILEDQYFDYTNVRLIDEDGNPYGVFCYAANVSERVLNRIKIEQGSKDLAALVRDLEQEKETRERFVMAITHDLRTPLTAVKMSAQLLARKAADPDFVRTVSERISKSVDRSDRMIGDLLDANRIKAGEPIPIQVEPCDFVEIVSSAIIELNAIYDSRFNLINDFQTLPGYWDRDAVQRVIENLSANAIKYGKKDAPVVITVSKDETGVEVSVHNQGNVIEIEDRAKIFSQFSRTSSAITGGQIGWGVGLTLVKGITEAHGGSVSLESELGKGTTFFIKLPQDTRKQQ